MQRNETHRVADANPPRIRKGTVNQVFDEDDRRVHGLWIRNGAYYAQIRPSHPSKLASCRCTMRRLYRKPWLHGKS